MKKISSDTNIAKIVTYFVLGSTTLTFSSYAAAEDTQLTATTESSGGAKMEEIVVSARRVRENAQTVPISITALTEDSLRRDDIRTATDLDKDVPGLTICCGKGQADYNFL